MTINEDLRRSAELANLYALLANYYEYRDPLAHAHYYKQHLQHVGRAAALALELDPPPNAAAAALAIELGPPPNAAAAAGEAPSAHPAVRSGWGMMSPHAPAPGIARSSPPAASLARSSPSPASLRETARVRAIHAIPDASAVDVYVNGRRLLSGITYKATTDYFVVPAGVYRVDMFAAGSTEAPLVTKQVTAAAGASYTFALLGTAVMPDFASFTDQPFAPPSSVHVRFLHLSPDAPAIDIVAPGGQWLSRNVGFREPSHYMTLVPSTYDLEIREAGTPNVLLSIPNLKLGSGTAYTIAAVGCAIGHPPLEAKLLRG
jgi:hypothetical protein